MKAVKTITTGVVLLAAAAGVVHLCDDEIIPSCVRSVSVALGISKAQLGSYIGSNVDGSEWKDTANLQKRLSREILEKLQGLGNSSVKAFLSSPRNRLMLAQWQLAENDRCTAELSAKRLEGLAKEMERLSKEIDKNEALM